MTDTPSSLTTYTLPTLVMLSDDSRVDELKALTQRMHDHLQQVRLQLFLGEVYRNWPQEGVDSVKFVFYADDDRETPEMYALCDGPSKAACNAFRYLIQQTAPRDENCLLLFRPLANNEHRITLEGMESLWRTFVGPEAVAQHLDANMEGTQGQPAPKLRM